MSSTPSQSISLSRHTLRQLKFVIPGGAITYYLGTHEVFWKMINGMGREGWGRCVKYTGFIRVALICRSTMTEMFRIAAVMSLVLGLVIVALFLYVLLVPWIRGIEPNVSPKNPSHKRFHRHNSPNCVQYLSWRESGVLSSVIPVLTASIVMGWSLLSVTLGLWSSLGYFEGIIGGKFPT